MVKEQFQHKLMGLNCAYNYEEWPDGSCYSDTCSMNIDPMLARQIHENGCKVFKRMPEAIEEIKRKQTP
jgi:hypothetical protein